MAFLKQSAVEVFLTEQKCVLFRKFIVPVNLGIYLDISDILSNSTTKLEVVVLLLDVLKYHEDPNIQTEEVQLILICLKSIHKIL